MPDPILVAAYASVRDDNGRPYLPALLCPECQRGFEAAGLARDVFLVDGVLTFDDGAPVGVGDGCAFCGDDLTAEEDPFANDYAA